MRTNYEKLILKHSYPIFEDLELLKQAINNIPLDLSEIHITKGVSLFEVETNKEDSKLTVIIDKNLIQFTFKNELDYSLIKVIFESFPVEFNSTFKLPLLLIEGNIDKDAKKENFNHLLNFSNGNFGLKHIGVDYSIRDNHYKITSTIRKNDINISLRIPLKVNIDKLNEKINLAKTELYDEVLPAFNKFIGSEKK